MMDIYYNHVEKCRRIKNIEFLWSPYEKSTQQQETCLFHFNPSTVNNGGEPAAPLPKGCEDHLLVAQFAWDGGSYVGNEYWGKQLSASGDPAAMCCSAMPELAVPRVQPRHVDHVRIYG